MKASIEVLYDRISTITIADYKMNSTMFADASFCLFAVEIIEALGFDFCYNWKELKGRKTFQWWYKSILFPPENHYGTKVNHSINSPFSFSWIYRDLIRHHARPETNPTC